VRRELEFSAGASLRQVSAILLEPPEARWLYVLAHGAGAGMRHPFMEAIAERLAERGVATFRYQFPYMEAALTPVPSPSGRGGRQRPDPPAVAQATVRAAVETAGTMMSGIPLIAGGKSFGGRMTSQAAALEAFPGVRGLAFLGFPLHAPGQASIKRADHLDQVSVPMLFLQGTRDTLAELELVKSVCQRLGKNAELHVVEGADHSFKVLKRSGRTDAQALDELADTISSWADTLPPPKPR